MAGGELEEDLEGGVDLVAFDHADVVAVAAGGLADTFLGEDEAGAELADGSAKLRRFRCKWVV